MNVPNRSGLKVLGGADTDCCEPECCGNDAPAKSTVAVEPAQRRVDVELQYLDLSVCTRCQDAEKILDEARKVLAPLLETLGVELSVRKTHVRSEEQARELGFVTSPTIRVNGRDIQPEVRESPCDSCGSLCGCGEDFGCRIWTYQGEDHTSPPKAMVADAILGELYGRRDEAGDDTGSKDVPDSLKRFFAQAGAQT